MERTLAVETLKKIGKKVKLAGWVDRRRDHGKLVFIDLKDRSGTVQIVGKEELGELRISDVIEVEGKVRKRPKELINPKLPTGEIEVGVEKIKVLSKTAEDMPIPIRERGKIRTSLTKRLDWRWLDLRKNKNRLIFQIWTKMEETMRKYFLSHGFIQIHSPKFMSAPSETGAEVFAVPYFGKTAYLAQSPQFYKQMAMAAGFERVFEIGPVFRANPSFTSRHDTEFTMVDMEMSFIESHENVMKFLENLVQFTIKSVKEEFGEIIKESFERELIIPKLPFPRLTMKEAKATLKKAGKIKTKKGDLNAEEEKSLCKIVKKKTGHEFVYVTEYPFETRPFYHMKKEKDTTLTRSFDLLWNGMEIVTGAQREHRYEILKKQAKEKGLSFGPIKDYLNFFKFGCPPHGGFGLGPSRMLMKMLNVRNVREVTFVYRGVKRLTP